MDPTLVPGTRFASQFQICVYEHAILCIYISFFSNSSVSPYSLVLSADLLSPYGGYVTTPTPNADEVTLEQSARGFILALMNPSCLWTRRECMSICAFFHYYEI